MHTFYPDEPQFPIGLNPLAGLGAHFRMGSTFAKYVQHLRKAHRVLRLGDLPEEASIKEICRGVSKDNAPLEVYGCESGDKYFVPGQQATYSYALQS